MRAFIHSGLGCSLNLNWPKSDASHLIVSGQEMMTIEKEIFSNGMPIEALMEKVGNAISSWILDRQSLIEHGAVVLVGPGHNGGDGLIVARELYLKGVDVSIWCPFKVKKDLTLRHLNYAKWIGIRNLQQQPELNPDLLWIEALFGLRQTRVISDEIIDLLICKQKISPSKLISIDVPAGLCSDSGKAISNDAYKASSTLTLGLYKSGLIQDSALNCVGNLERVDLGIPEKVLADFSEEKPLRITFSDLKTFNWPQPGKNKSKYQRGRVLIIAGSNKYRGAASLVMNGVLASGVGSVNAILPKKVSGGLWSIFPEVVLAGELNDHADGSLNLSDSLDELNLEKFDCILLGPGIGVPEGINAFGNIFQEFKGLLVLDADGINRLAMTEQSWQWLCQRNGPTWLTPHLGEFERLFPFIDSSNPLKAGIKAAKLTGASVLLKGAHSVIADPQGKTWQIGQVDSSVARTGLGDVLAGFVSGMGALGFAANRRWSTELLAASALLHAFAGASSIKGSKATSICEFLSELVKRRNYL